MIKAKDYFYSDKNRKHTQSVVKKQATGIEAELKKVDNNWRKPLDIAPEATDFAPEVTIYPEKILPKRPSAPAAKNAITKVYDPYTDPNNDQYYGKQKPQSKNQQQDKQGLIKDQLNTALAMPVQQANPQLKEPSPIAMPAPQGRKVASPSDAMPQQPRGEANPTAVPQTFISAGAGHRSKSDKDISQSPDAMPQQPRREDKPTAVPQTFISAGAGHRSKSDKDISHSPDAMPQQPRGEDNPTAVPQTFISAGAGHRSKSDKDISHSPDAMPRQPRSEDNPTAVPQMNIPTIAEERIKLQNISHSENIPVRPWLKDIPQKPNVQTGYGSMYPSSTNISQLQNISNKQTTEPKGKQVAGPKGISQEPKKSYTLSDIYNSLYDIETPEEKKSRERKERTRARIAAISDGIRALSDMIYAHNGYAPGHNPANDLTLAQEKRRQMLQQERDKNKAAWLAMRNKVDALTQARQLKDKELALERYNKDSTLAENKRYHDILAENNKERNNLSQQRIDLTKFKYQSDKDYKDFLGDIRKKELDGKISHWQAEDAVARARESRLAANGSGSGKSKTNPEEEYVNLKSNDPKGMEKAEEEARDQGFDTTTSAGRNATKAIYKKNKQKSSPQKPKAQSQKPNAKKPNTTRTTDKSSRTTLSGLHH